MMPLSPSEAIPQELTQDAPEDMGHTRETALAFQNNLSERNKQKSFLRYYKDEEQTGYASPTLGR